MWTHICTPAARHSSPQTDSAGLNKMELLIEVPLAETVHVEHQLCTLHTPYFVPESPIATALQLRNLGGTWPANV